MSDLTFWSSHEVVGRRPENITIRQERALQVIGLMICRIVTSGPPPFDLSRSLFVAGVFDHTPPLDDPTVIEMHPGGVGGLLTGPGYTFAIMSEPLVHSYLEEVEKDEPENARFIEDAWRSNFGKKNRFTVIAHDLVDQDFWVTAVLIGDQ